MAAGGTAHPRGRGFLRIADDPAVMSVLFEESAALLGLLARSLRRGLPQLTGSASWGGLVTVLIALLPSRADDILAWTDKGLLIGRRERTLKPRSARRSSRRTTRSARWSARSTR